MNTPGILIELAKASFPHPILLLTSSDNEVLWSLSESTQPLPPFGMKFMGPGWEIHLQEVEPDVIGLYHLDQVFKGILKRASQAVSSEKETGQS